MSFLANESTVGKKTPKKIDLFSGENVKLLNLLTFYIKKDKNL